MAGLHAPNFKEKPVPVLSDSQLKALVAACAGKTFEDRRDEAIIRLFFDAGLRVSELCSLETDSVDMHNAIAMIRGKGSKVRAVYPSAKTIRALDRYKRVRSQHRYHYLPDLFLSQRGPLSAQAVRERLKVRAEQAGITEKLNPHRLRHTWAHDWMVSGGQEGDLMRQAGWSTSKMLQRYGSSAADMRAREAARRLRRGDRI
jgi:site-specific recombinase XerD